MSLLVLGTDTGVGKTIAAAVIVVRYSAQRRLAYWKPIASGTEEARDTDLVAAAVAPEASVLPERYALRAPLSPDQAARLEGVELDPEAVLEALVAHALEDPERNLVIEGIGGLLVPLTERGYLLADLAREMQLPVLVVARAGLGTINHTLLTLEAARSRRLPVAGVLLNGSPHPENRKAIERFGRVEVLAELEPLAGTDREALRGAARGFDPEGRLGAYLE